MIDTADQRWLADHLSGETSMLLTTTNVQSVEGPGGHKTSWRRWDSWPLRTEIGEVQFLDPVEGQ